MVDGYIYVEHLSWDSFNESCDLQQAVKNYKERFGFYPAAVLADQIYRNRDNRSYCKKHDIRLSGPPLGRPPQDNLPNKALEKQDMKERNEIEGGFGVQTKIWPSPAHGASERDGRKRNHVTVYGNQFRSKAAVSFSPFFIHHYGRYIW
jgi:hypothetical protein